MLLRIPHSGGVHHFTHVPSGWQARPGPVRTHADVILSVSQGVIPGKLKGFLGGVGLSYCININQPVFHFSSSYIIYLI
jgi:hypothetical protein